MSLPSVRSLFRQFVQRPALMVAATATLGVSIGAATAISSAVKAVLLGPLPIDQPERLAVLWQTDLEKGVQTIELSSREYDAWRAHLTSFSGMAAVTAANIRNTLTGNPEPEQVESAIVSPNYFHVLGVRPRLGRDFGAQDARDTAGSTVLVSEGLWTRRYGRDPSLIGRTITVDGTPVTVVGVMPAGTLPRHADLFLNGTALAHDAPDLGVLKLVGRLQAGASLDAARAEVDLVAPRLTVVRPKAEVAGGRLGFRTDDGEPRGRRVDLGEASSNSLARTRPRPRVRRVGRRERGPVQEQVGVARQRARRGVVKVIVRPTSNGRIAVRPVHQPLETSSRRVPRASCAPKRGRATWKLSSYAKLRLPPRFPSACCSRSSSGHARERRQVCAPGVA